MYFNIKVFGFFAIVLLLNGCNYNPVIDGPEFSSAPVPKLKSGYGIVYIYRVDSEGGVSSAERIKANDNALINLKANGFTWVHLPEGNYLFTSETPGDWVGNNEGGVKSVSVESGKTTFLRLSVLVTTGTNVGASSFGGVSFSQGKSLYHELTVEPESEALIQLSSFKYQPSDSSF